MVKVFKYSHKKSNKLHIITLFHTMKMLFMNNYYSFGLDYEDTACQVHTHYTDLLLGLKHIHETRVYKFIMYILYFI